MFKTALRVTQFTLLFSLVSSASAQTNTPMAGVLTLSHHNSQTGVTYSEAEMSHSPNDYTGYVAYGTLRADPR